MMISGLSLQVSKRISTSFSINYKLDGVMLMNMINLCFLVGNGACGVIILNLKRSMVFDEQNTINIELCTFGG